VRPVALLTLVLLLVACGDEETDPVAPPADGPAFEWFIVQAGDTLRGRSADASVRLVQAGEALLATLELQGPDGLRLRLTSPPGRDVAKGVYEVDADDPARWHGWLDLPGGGAPLHFGKMWGDLVLEDVETDWMAGDFDLDALGTDAGGGVREPEERLDVVRGGFRARVERNRP
jgi:hypothetical protein